MRAVSGTANETSLERIPFLVSSRRERRQGLRQSCTVRLPVMRPSSVLR